MADWHQNQEFNLASISSMSLDAVGFQANSDGRGLTGTTAWPTANKAFYIPFIIYTPRTAYKMSGCNAAPSGNIDMGIYDDQGHRLVSKGSTAAAGANQELDITDTILQPGVYYMAIAVDNTTHTHGAATPLAAVAGAWGVLEQASAFPLPSSATFAAMTAAYVPIFAVQLRTVV